MNKHILYIVLAFFINVNYSYPQTENNKTKEYQFLIYDGMNNSTMNRFNTNYLSFYRLASNELNKIEFQGKKKHWLKSSIKIVFISFLGSPLTHEEGHRSVLTNKSIGSINQPFFNKKGAAYVKGVTDKVLLNLRDTDFSNYIRLHTGGLESDYTLSKKTADLLVFKEDDFSVLREEYVFRKLIPIQYHLTSFFPKMMPDIQEESDELERDIVGHDIWGMARHLHRPNMNFYRYTQFGDLTSEEHKYVKKIAWRSMINLMDPILIGKRNFQLSKSIKFNMSLAHSLSPFGDFFDQNFWLIYNEKYKLSSYIREYFNKENTFFAGGIALKHLVISDNISSSISIDVWNQPKNLLFDTYKSDLGYGIDLQMSYKIFINKDNTKIKNAGLFLDLYNKSNGFLPGYASLKNDFGIRLGAFFSY